MRLKWRENGNATTIVVYIFESRIMEDILSNPFLGIANSDVYAFLCKNQEIIRA